MTPLACVFTKATDLLVPSTSSLHAAGVHSFSAASAGAIATMVTHPFDVVKACMFGRCS